MQPELQHPGFDAWLWLIGTWSTEATHPGLHDTVVSGEATFEWLEDQHFLIHRTHYDHPELPDAVAVIGVVDGRLLMHYFDVRGVHRTFTVEITADTWRYWNDTPGFAQRFTGTLSDDGTAITGLGELSRDGAAWEDDLTITYRRVG
jgi:hypothetical protein